MLFEVRTAVTDRTGPSFDERLAVRAARGWSTQLDRDGQKIESEKSGCQDCKPGPSSAGPLAGVVDKKNKIIDATNDLKRPSVRYKLRVLH